MLGLCCCSGFSLVAESRDYSPVVLNGLLTVVASLVLDYGLCGAWASIVAACGLSSCSSQALEEEGIYPGLSAAG